MSRNDQVTRQWLLLKKLESTRGVTLVEAGDIPAQELVIGGSFAATATAAKLKEMGADVFPGVRKAAETIIAKLGS